MRLRFFGGLAIDAPETPGGTAAVRGRGQEALLFRLALDPGSTVRLRALIEDVWPDDPPEDPRAALQSLASRLRRALPSGVLDAAPGGYRLLLDRDAVDVTHFQDLVAAARRADDPSQAASLARSALDLWTGDPWVPSDSFDWVVHDLFEDRGHAERLLRPGGEAVATPPAMPVAPAAGAVPAALTTLVGRRSELDLIDLQLASERLVTLLGPGGAGKTTLALETARRRPGSVVVELAPAGRGEVWAAVAGVVGRTIRLADTPAVPTTSRERALDALAGRRVLIVLDNCEHVSAEAAAVAVDLLRNVPGAQLLATSREPLGLPGEAFVDLGPLPEADATELFVRRVRAARGQPPATADADAVARIVRRLDGLPLALELAAARSRTLSIAEIDVGLDDRFALLAVGPRAADPRHQTLRALIDWSWETLTDPERTALLAAAVFPDGLDVGDTGVVGDHFDTQAGAFDQLVDRSLLHRADRRLRMLETVREYGVDRLRSDGREADFRTRQARAVALLATSRDALLRGPRVREGLAWFDANEENISQAVRTAAGSPELRQVGVSLVRGALWAWMMRERFEDLQAGLTTFAAPDDPIDSEAAVVVNGLGLLVQSFLAATAARGTQPQDPDKAELAGFVEAADRVAEAAARYPSELSAAIPPLLGAVARALADPPGAGARWSWSRSLMIEVDDEPALPAWTQAFVCLMRAVMAQNSGALTSLGVESERALSRFSDLQDVWGFAVAAQMRSEWLMLEGRLDEALELADRSAEGLRGLTSASDLIQQRTLSLNVLVRLGRWQDAHRRVEEIMSIATTDGSERALVQADLAAASLAIALGNGALALRHLDATRGESGSLLEQMVAWDATLRARALMLCERHDEARTTLRQALPAALHTGDQPIIADAALSLAMWLAGAGREDDARRALAASVHLRGGLDASDPALAGLVARLGLPGGAEGDGAQGNDAEGNGAQGNATEGNATEGDADIAALVALLD